MNIQITDDSEQAVDIEQFVTKVFDGIKCAAATDNTFRLYLNKYETKYFSDLIKKVSYLEIY